MFSRWVSIKGMILADCRESCPDVQFCRVYSGVGQWKSRHLFYLIVALWSGLMLLFKHLRVKRESGVNPEPTRSGKGKSRR